MPEYFDSTSPTPKKTKVIKGYGNPHKEEKKKKDKEKKKPGMFPATGGKVSNS